MSWNEPQRSFEQQLEAIRWYLVHPDADRRDVGLMGAVFGVFHFFEELLRDPERVHNLLDVARALRASTGPGRAIAEDRMMNHLDHLTRESSYILEKAGHDRLADREVAGILTPKARRVRQIVLGLCGYALECLDFKRPHDSFGGRRKLLAFEILATASKVIELPEAVARAREAVRKGRGTAVRGALEFLRDYYVRRKAAPPHDVVEELEALVDRTDSRWIALGALNVLVDTKVISELIALGRMDDWKERLYFRIKV
jgi:hypothetical protein